MMRLPHIALGLVGICAASMATGHTLAECERITHISHGGVMGHRDLGENKVGWLEWWSQEGVYKTLWIAECDTGRTLSIRTHEERIKDRHIHDRTEKAVGIVERQAASGPFFTLERTAEALKKAGRDIEIAASGAEFCACHAVYPDLRGDKTQYGGQS